MIAVPVAFEAGADVFADGDGLTIEYSRTGDKGDRSTITVGTVDTVAPGDPATVTNVGTDIDAVFNFEIPQGATGATGAAGPPVSDGDKGDIVITGGVWGIDPAVMTSAARTFNAVADVPAQRVTIGITTGATDNAALRADGTGGATMQGSALLIADTTGALSRSGGGGVPIQGTNTNDDAPAGFIGQYSSQPYRSGPLSRCRTASWRTSPASR